PSSIPSSSDSARSGFMISASSQINGTSNTIVEEDNSSSPYKFLSEVSPSGSSEAFEQPLEPSLDHLRTIDTGSLLFLSNMPENLTREGEVTDPTVGHIILGTNDSSEPRREASPTDDADEEMLDTGGASVAGSTVRVEDLSAQVADEVQEPSGPTLGEQTSTALSDDGTTSSGLTSLSDLSYISEARSTPNPLATPPPINDISIQTTSMGSSSSTPVDATPAMQTKKPRGPRNRASDRELAQLMKVDLRGGHPAAELAQNDVLNNGRRLTRKALHAVTAPPAVTTGGRSTRASASAFRDATLPELPQSNGEVLPPPPIPSPPFVPKRLIIRPPANPGSMFPSGATTPPSSHIGSAVAHDVGHVRLSDDRMEVNGSGERAAVLDGEGIPGFFETNSDAVQISRKRKDNALDRTDPLNKRLRVSDLPASGDEYSDSADGTDLGYQPSLKEPGSGALGVEWNVPQLAQRDFDLPGDLLDGDSSENPPNRYTAMGCEGTGLPPVAPPPKLNEKKSHKKIVIPRPGHGDREHNTLGVFPGIIGRPSSTASGSQAPGIDNPFKRVSASEALKMEVETALDVDLIRSSLQGVAYNMESDGSER
ncbi:hypothetical protein HDU93_001564, partial [Gonapodya sp. JEL0774]